MANALKMYVLYNSPTDYPGMFLIRVWYTVAGNPEPVPADEPLIVTVDIKDCQAFMEPKGLTWLKRSDSDDACIVGTWV